MRKKFLSVFLIVVMVTATAAACSGKDEAEGADASKTETTVAEDDEKDAQQEDANRPPDEEEVAETERVALTEEDIASLKSTIKSTVIEEYIKPNGVDPASTALH